MEALLALGAFLVMVGTIEASARLEHFLYERRLRTQQKKMVEQNRRLAKVLPPNKNTGE